MTSAKTRRSRVEVEERRRSRTSPCVRRPSRAIIRPSRGPALAAARLPGPRPSPSPRSRSTWYRTCPRSAVRCLASADEFSSSPGSPSPFWSTKTWWSEVDPPSWLMMNRAGPCHGDRVSIRANGDAPWAAARRSWRREDKGLALLGGERRGEIDEDQRSDLSARHQRRGRGTAPGRASSAVRALGQEAQVLHVLRLTHEERHAARDLPRPGHAVNSATVSAPPTPPPRPQRERRTPRM